MLASHRSGLDRCVGTTPSQRICRRLLIFTVNTWGLTEWTSAGSMRFMALSFKDAGFWYASGFQESFLSLQSMFPELPVVWFLSGRSIWCCSPHQPPYAGFWKICFLSKSSDPLSLFSCLGWKHNCSCTLTSTAARLSTNRLNRLINPFHVHMQNKQRFQRGRKMVLWRVRIKVTDASDLSDLLQTWFKLSIS